MEKAIVATDHGDQGAVILVQGPEGDAQQLAREVVGSLDWQ